MHQSLAINYSILVFSKRAEKAQQLTTKISHKNCGFLVTFPIFPTARMYDQSQQKYEAWAQITKVQQFQSMCAYVLSNINQSYDMCDTSSTKQTNPNNGLGGNILYSRKSFRWIP